MKYQTPEQFYFRLHHIRPRFKNNVEEVLIFMATELSKMKPAEKKEFIAKFDGVIRLFPENATKEEKTIKNWRTEISSLFGLVETDGDQYKTGHIAFKLAENQDLVEFFKYFLFRFQYPGGHLKPHESVKCINAGIKFKPVQFILKLLEIGEKALATDGGEKRFYLTKAELTHCIFNDLRFTTGQLGASEALKLITDNRKTNTQYDWSGDVVRYAGDILDYMVLANLLEIRGNNYVINWGEREAITKFLTSTERFSLYDKFYGDPSLKSEDISALQDEWFHFVNRDLGSDLFKTDVLKYLGIKEETYETLVQGAIASLHEDIERGDSRTKNIGDLGENLIVGHESMRLKVGGREDLIRLIKKIPNHFAMGFDIQSVEFDERTRCIEVKSTISSKKLNFYNVHLTPNEWSAAESFGERYFIYRLVISKEGRDLFIIQDPVDKYRQKLMKMSPRNGADIVFSDQCGERSELLIWQK
ncbi:DUF3883 domain-containing protein [Candidatus Peregrinibacteria bacterium]|nr:MAG: DUF3883 domain-containing protein [Candidatus Peregrinibacteria bacterium]